MSLQIRLTPRGQLRLEALEEHRALLASLQHTFQTDWREGLLTLAAEKMALDEAPTVRYWQALAARYLTSLCDIPGTAATFEIEAPSLAECFSLVLTAPPMQGGEYLSDQVLQTIWEALDQWVHEAVVGTERLTAFLQKRAPKWHQVGRVCFHLAENQSHEDRPFAPLRQLVGPYILRRLKTDRTIIADLPEKTETPRYCHLTKPQVQLYEPTVRTLQTALTTVDAMARRGLVLQTLLRLKQIGSHPSQLAGDGAYKPADRAFCIGQRRNVLVHKFITSGTIAERIDMMLADKRQFAEDILRSDNEVNLTELPDEELLRLVRLDVSRAAV